MKDEKKTSFFKKIFGQNPLVAHWKLKKSIQMK